MKTENLSTLKIHKLTQEQYDRELAAGRLDENALYLTPDTVCDTDSPVESVNGKTGAVQITASDIDAIPTSRKINNKELSADITLSASDVGADVSGSANTSLTNAKAYTDAKITELVGDKKVSDQISTAIADLINGAPTTLDTLGEIATAMEENSDVVKVLEEAIGSKSDTDHTHNYAGSSSAGGSAISANKLNTDAGSEIQPVYFKNGVPVETTYTVKTSVPENAVFTDTTYSVATQSADGLLSANDKKTIDNLSALVGDTKVSTQIENAIKKIDYPVDSVNGKTGAVELTASDVNAVSIEEFNNLNAGKADAIQSASGEVIAVNNSAYTPLKGLKIFGKTEQRTTTGKNLLNYDAWNAVPINKGTAVFENNGVTLTASQDDCYTHYMPTVGYPESAKIPVQEGDTITVSWEATSNVSGLVGVFMDGGATKFKTADNANVRQLSYTVPAGYTFVTIRFGVAKAGNTITYKNIMVERSPVATTYEPYTGGIPSPNPDYPQALESVGDGGSVTTTVCGKNLLPIENHDITVQNIHWIVKDGAYTAVGTANEINNSVITVILTNRGYKAGTYYISGGTTNIHVQIAFDDGSGYKTRVSGQSVHMEDFDKYLSVIAQIYVPKGFTVNETAYPMITLFPDDTYEAPKEPTTATVTPVTGTGESLKLPGIPVTFGGNYTDPVTGKQWICDEVDFEKGVYVQRVKKIVLSGEEVWTSSSLNAPYTISVDDLADCTDSDIRLLCDRYPAVNIADSWLKYDYLISRAAGNSNALQFRNVNIPSLAEWKAALAENPITVQYILAEENHIDLTPGELAQYAAMHTNYPNTTVFNDAGAEMVVKYYTPNTAVQMVHSPSDEGKVLTIDQHGCVILKEGTQTTLSSLGVTATATELNYVDGVTSNIQTQLNNKANASHGTHVSYSTTAPVMDGTASAGSATTVARSDHKHPTDTSRASKTEFDTHTANTSKHITDTERTNWNAAKSHADSAHNYLPLAGGTLSGNTTINNAGARYRVTNGTNTTWFGMNSAGSTIGIYDETNKKYLIQHDGTNTQLNGNCTGNAGSATKVYTTATNSSTYKSYQIPFVSGDTSGNSNLLKNNGIKFDVRDGTTSQNGVALLLLGDTTVSGTDGNKSGGLYMYNSKGKYAAMIPAENTGNITITLPSATGTLATTADINALRDEFANGSW